MPWIRATLSWLLLGVAMFSYGIFRVVLMEPFLGERAAHQAGTLVACAVALAIAYFAVPWIGGMETRRRRLGLGLYWVGLTISFELVLRGLVFDLRWSQLFADYNLLAGRLWGLLLAVIFFAPSIAMRWGAARTPRNARARGQPPPIP